MVPGILRGGRGPGVAVQQTTDHRPLPGHGSSSAAAQQVARANLKVLVVGTDDGKLKMANDTVGLQHRQSPSVCSDRDASAALGWSIHLIS